MADLVAEGVYLSFLQELRDISMIASKCLHVECIEPTTRGSQNQSNHMVATCCISSTKWSKAKQSASRLFMRRKATTLAPRWLMLKQRMIAAMCLYVCQSGTHSAKNVGNVAFAGWKFGTIELRIPCRRGLDLNVTYRLSIKVMNSTCHGRNMCFRLARSQTYNMHDSEWI